MSNYAFEGPKWSSSVITWSFAAAGGDFSNAISGAYQDTVRAAIARWSQVSNLTFKEVPDGTSVNVRIGWGTFSGTQVGETHYSYQQIGSAQNFVAGSEVRLEDPSARSIGTGASDFYQGTSTTLYEVVLHEFGHALGLAHSTDPTAVMYASVGPSDNGLGNSDIQGIQQLYGAPAANASAAMTAQILPSTINLGGGTVAVYRFFDTSNGTQFLTASASERDNVLMTRPDLTYEGLGLAGIAPGADPTAIPVYRFFDTSNGTHFFTSSQSEEATILATRTDLVLEQTTFFEHATPQAGDIPVFRFFDKNDGTHFFTSSASERSTLVATRSDMAYEGIAFYAPSASSANASSSNAAPQAANAAAAGVPVISVSDDTELVYGFTGADGRQFLTADQSERDAVSATVPTLTYQGAAMGAISPAAGDADAAPVFRFFDTVTGDHFLTANTNEAAQIAATRPDMVDEQVSFYEHLTQQAGDVPVYRFFDTATGTHLYTASATEQAATAASRPEMAYEGVAFYAPSITG